MKTFFNNIMKITPQTIIGTDYSGIVLLHFIIERLEHSNYERNCNINEFACYMYRFYSDKPEIRMKHYDKMIQNVFHYAPLDFCGYCKTYLKNLDEIGLIKLKYDSFDILYPFEEEKEFKLRLGILKNLVSTISMKYLGSSHSFYSSTINEEEYLNKRIFIKGDRVFNRVIERRNYCFICDDYNLDDLAVVKLIDNDVKYFDCNNFILLCREHANLFLNGELEIRKNGYAYLNGIRIYSHLPINELKQIRKNLK